MIWNKKLIKFDVAFMQTALQTVEPLKAIYRSTRKISVSKETLVLPKYLKLNRFTDAKGDFYNEYLFGYRTGTLTMDFLDIKPDMPVECQIPYSEWINYSHFVVCIAERKRKSNNIKLLSYKVYES